MRIAESAQDVGIRGGALWALVQLQNGDRVIPYLRRIASSENPAATDAVELLATETGPTGRAAAKALFQEGAVKQATAREALSRFAMINGWR
jgi:hypothetical protein